MSSKVTDEQIVDALETGLNVHQVSRALGVSRERVRKLRDAEGLARAPGLYERRRDPTPEEIQAACEALPRRPRTTTPYTIPVVRRDRRWNGQIM